MQAVELPVQSTDAKLQAVFRRESIVKLVTLPVLLVTVTLACGGGQSGDTGQADTLTQRQRDSILAQSRIPGARGVGRAMQAADSISARVRAADTVAP